MQWAIGFLVGLAAGIAANWLTTLYFAFKQFKSSTAWERVSGVEKATKVFKILRANMTQPQTDSVPRRRDEFRYSLGVIVQYLTDTFGNPVSDFAEGGPWPIVTEFNCDGTTDDNKRFTESEGKPYDRWRFFNIYVRPVIEDINPSTLVLNSPWFFAPRRVNQLRDLLKLCLAIESATAKVDAAVEIDPLLLIVKEGDKWIMKPKDPSDSRVKEVKEAMNELYLAWKNWIAVCE